MRVALGIEYDGSAFSGWQRQHGTRTVQAALEQALSRVADHTVRVSCAGRTDSGVHALYQVVHFDTEAVRSDRSWVLGANSNLPHDVGVLWARPMPAAFDARFSATRRAYVYLICNRQTRPGLWHGRVTWECRPLDVPSMARAARHWLGEHDFSAFRAQGCQSRHPVRTVHRFDVERRHGLIVLHVEANAFLQHMVRNFAGVLLHIGMGRRSSDWAAEVLAWRDRARGGVTAPPDGLYLCAVRYPEAFTVPAPPRDVPWPSAFAGRAFG